MTGKVFTKEGGCTYVLAQCPGTVLLLIVGGLMNKPGDGHPIAISHWDSEQVDLWELDD